MQMLILMMMGWQADGQREDAEGNIDAAAYADADAVTIHA